MDLKTSDEEKKDFSIHENLFLTSKQLKELNSHRLYLKFNMVELEQAVKEYKVTKIQESFKKKLKLK